MSLKYSMDSVKDVDPILAGLYTKADSGEGYVLTGIEGVVSKSKVDTFRDNNVELMKKLDKFKDVDIDKIAQTDTELKEALIKLENAGVVDEETVNKLVESRVAQIQQDSATTIDGLNTQLSTTKSQLESMILSSSVNDAAAEHKIRPEALTDVTLRAQQTFSLENGAPVAKDKDGNKLYGDDGVTELTINNWVKGLIKTSPHLFQESVTGGLNNNSNSFSGDPSKLSPAQKISIGLN